MDLEWTIGCPKKKEKYFWFKNQSKHFFHSPEFFVEFHNHEFIQFLTDWTINLSAISNPGAIQIIMEKKISKGARAKFIRLPCYFSFQVLDQMETNKGVCLFYLCNPQFLHSVFHTLKLQNFRLKDDFWCVFNKQI